VIDAINEGSAASICPQNGSIIETTKLQKGSSNRRSLKARKDS